MTRVVYVVGAPGVGKSTATALWLAKLGGIDPEVVFLYITYYEVKAHPERPPQRHTLDGHHLLDGSGVVVGKYGTRAKFEGTDALGFSSSTSMARWFADTDALLPDLVVGEGARMPGTTMATVAQHSSLALVHLTAPDAVLQARRAERGSDQKAGWVASQVTKVNNTVAAVAAAGGTIVTLDTENSSPEEISDMLTALC